jgi:hypothetical protein
MVYAMKGKKITREEILRDFRHGEKGEFSYTPQLARHLLANGLPNRLHIAGSNFGLLPSWRGLTKEEVIDNLKVWLTLHAQDESHLDSLHILFYLQEGGEIAIEAYTADTLKSLLGNGSVLIVCIDEAWIWQHRRRLDNKRVMDDLVGGREGHFVVITGYTGDMLHVLDPFPTNIPGRHGAYDIEANEIVNASLTWDPQIIEILA